MQQELTNGEISRCPICKAGSGAERSLLAHLKEVHGYPDYQAERMVMRLRSWSRCEPSLERQLFRGRISDVLNPYQMEILELIAAGNSIDEIAAAMGSSIRSIEDQIELICRTLGAHNGQEAVARLVFAPPAANVNEELPRTRSRAFGARFSSARPDDDTLVS